MSFFIYSFIYFFKDSQQLVSLRLSTQDAFICIWWLCDPKFYQWYCFSCVSLTSPCTPWTVGVKYVYMKLSITDNSLWIIQNSPFCTSTCHINIAICGVTVQVYIGEYILFHQDVAKCMTLDLIRPKPFIRNILIGSFSKKVNVCMTSWSTLSGCRRMLGKIAMCTCWRMACCCGWRLLRTLLTLMMLSSTSMTTWCHCWSSLLKIWGSAYKSPQHTHCSVLSNSLQSKWYFVVAQVSTENLIFLFLFIHVFLIDFYSITMGCKLSSSKVDHIFCEHFVCMLW